MIPSARGGVGGVQEEEDGEPPDLRNGDGVMSDLASEMTIEEANIFLAEIALERKREGSPQDQPRSFLDLVDDCLFLCGDSVHDATWDALVMQWAFKLEKSSREEGTLFTTCWEEEDIPVMFDEAITKRRLKFKKDQENQIEVANTQEETMVTDGQEPGLQTGLEVLLEPHNSSMRQNDVQGERLQEDNVQEVEKMKEEVEKMKKASHQQNTVEQELRDASLQQQLQEKTPGKSKRGNRSPEAVMRRYRRWLDRGSGKWTSQSKGVGRRHSGWDLEISRHTKLKLLPKPQKLVFSPQASPQKQEQLRDIPSFQQLRRQVKMEGRSERKGRQGRNIQSCWFEQREKQEPSPKQRQETKKKEPPSRCPVVDRKDEVLEERASTRLWREEEERLLDARFSVWLKNQVRMEVEEVLGLRETHSLRLEGMEENGGEAQGASPSHYSATQPVSASSQQTFSMLRQEGELMMGVSETPKVPRLVELWGGCGAEGSQRAYCWSCREWGSLVRFS